MIFIIMNWNIQHKHKMVFWGKTSVFTENINVLVALARLVHKNGFVRQWVIVEPLEADVTEVKLVQQRFDLQVQSIEDQNLARWLKFNFSFDPRLRIIVELVVFVLVTRFQVQIWSATWEPDGHLGVNVAVQRGAIAIGQNQDGCMFSMGQLIWGGFVQKWRHVHHGPLVHMALVSTRMQVAGKDQHQVQNRCSGKTHDEHFSALKKRVQISSTWNHEQRNDW